MYDKYDIFIFLKSVLYFPGKVIGKTSRSSIRRLYYDYDDIISYDIMIMIIHNIMMIYRQFES